MARLHETPSQASSPFPLLHTQHRARDPAPLPLPHQGRAEDPRDPGRVWACVPPCEGSPMAGDWPRTSRSPGLEISHVNEGCPWSISSLLGNGPSLLPPVCPSPVLVLEEPCVCRSVHTSVCSCPLFSPRLPPVETVQRNPELVLEGGPLAPLPPGDGFLETSIPVPALTSQDGPRPGCAECV